MMMTNSSGPTSTLSVLNIVFSDTNPDNARRHAPASARNRDPVLSVLRTALPNRGTVLEIGSGSGEHTAFFAPFFPTLEWQPSDLDTSMFPSIIDWSKSALDNNPNTDIRPPVQLDTCKHPWPVDHADAILALNMIHISPWASCVGLMAGARDLLPPGGLLYLYGPFKQDGHHTAPSNAEFDDNLRKRYPLWGVRDLEDVLAVAAEHDLHLDRTIPMPANNLSVLLRR